MLPGSIPASRSRFATSPASRRSMPGSSTLSRAVIPTVPSPNSFAIRDTAAICGAVITPARTFPRTAIFPFSRRRMTPGFRVFFMSVIFRLSGMAGFQVKSSLRETQTAYTRDPDSGA